MFTETSQHNKRVDYAREIWMNSTTKMSVILCSIVSLAIVSTGVSVELGFKGDGEWLSWKKQHSRVYETDIHELEKYVTWKSNKAYIDAHNELKDEFGYILTLNQFGDLVSDSTTSSL